MSCEMHCGKNKHFFVVVGLTLVGLLIYCKPLPAQIVLPVNGKENDHIVGVAVDLNPEFTVQFNYQQRIGNPNHQAIIGMEMQFAPLILRNGAYKVNLYTGVSKTLNKAKLMMRPGLFLAHLLDRAGEKTGYGFDIGLSYHKQNEVWSNGIEMTWLHTFLLKVSPSWEARETFQNRYAGEKGPVARWYHHTANRFRVGFVAARSIGDHMTIQFSAGSSFVLQRQGIALGFAHAQVPLYGSVAIRYQGVRK